MKKNLTVFCGARFPFLPEHELTEFKKEIQSICFALSEKYHLVYGGGQVGLMGLVADSFIEKKAHVTGIIPRYLNTVEIQHLGVSETDVVDDLHQRKAKMEKLADSYLILPGGIGTLDELCEILTLQTLNRHQKTICIYNWHNCFDGFIQFINDGIKKGFVQKELLSNCVISNDYTSILKKLL